jgi:lambda repressor-like predicted transcriptional regulator
MCGMKAPIKKMKNNKAAGPSGVVVDMLKATGDAGAIWVTDIGNLVLKERRILEDWHKSWIVNAYKGKGDALECGSYRGIKLLEHVMKILERFTEAEVRRICKVDGMPFFVLWQERRQSLRGTKSEYGRD